MYACQGISYPESNKEATQRVELQDKNREGGKSNAQEGRLCEDTKRGLASS